MAPKQRKKENKGLPKRWRLKNGAYRYLVPPGQEHQWDNKKEFTLGKTLSEAYATWADRMQQDGSELNNMGKIMDRYLLEVVPEKSYKAQQSDQLAIRRLRPVFGAMRPDDIEPAHAYQYFDLVQKKHGFTSGKHDIGTLRHMLTKAVQWGVIRTNQLKGQIQIRKKDYGQKQRDRLVEDWEINEALELQSSYRGVQIAQPYIRFKLMTGLRRNDILSLQLTDIKEDGIHVQPSKTRNSSGKRLIIEWDEDGELEALIEEIKKIKPRRIGNAYLFTTRQNKPYIDDKGQCNAFDSLWQRFMDKVLSETRVTDRFQERDLRAKVASESDTLVEASERLGHASTEITQRVYRRKPVRVQPLVRGKKD